MKKGYSIPLKYNGAPDFSKYLAQVAKGQKNQIKMKLTGSYHADFKEADRLAGFTKDTPRPEKTTWHHVEDFNPKTGTATMQLVKTDAHKAATPHEGSAAQYRKHNNGKGYGK